MSKGIKALERLRNDECYCIEEFNECYDAIDNVLKALDIIKKYYSLYESCDELFPYGLKDMQYVSSRSSNIMSKEEYDLLKEIL